MMLQQRASNVCLTGIGMVQTIITEAPMRLAGLEAGKVLRIDRMYILALQWGMT
jgi:hypothetical protein